MSCVMPFASLPTVGGLPRRSDSTTRDPDHLRETAADVTSRNFYEVRYLVRLTGACSTIMDLICIPFCPS